MSKNKLTLQYVDVFTTTPGQGNPALVVLGADDLADDAMAALAHDSGLETAFVLPPSASAPNANLRLRYFSPKGEMNLCGHATIGSLWLLAGRDEYSIETAAGLLRGKVDFEEARPVRARLQQPSPIFDETNHAPEKIARVLNLAPEKIGTPVIAASTGRSKLMIPLPDYATLDSIQLDSNLLAEICTLHNLTGFYPFTLHPRQPVTAEARQFPYNVGFVEDPVTGLAMAALAAYLLQYKLVETTPPETHLIIEQGYACGRAGRADIFVRSDEHDFMNIELGGQAVIIDPSL